MLIEKIKFMKLKKANKANLFKYKKIKFIRNTDYVCLMYLKLNKIFNFV